eukprot:CAMPEP_0119327368 /NCGR_PEP_ID=MMETSP1333-20130426/70612_1 /TAXON_ID=418940 /ORGANISM="Scyphosphaera apsteinii, Strain RCC1455" /LENGTH=74 /DNA_ID=CAMNT_0007335945 /DNA_START=239 /DNA_END=459 /DNA_ORIENTATION=-
MVVLATPLAFEADQLVPFAPRFGAFIMIMVGPLVTSLVCLLENKVINQGRALDTIQVCVIACFSGVAENKVQSG